MTSVAQTLKPEWKGAGDVPNRNKDLVSEMQTSAGTFASVGWGGEEKLTLKTFYCLRKIKTE